MQTKTINVYNFNELSKKVQEKVIDNNRDILLHEEWDKDIIEYKTQQLENLGFNNVKIYYSGFSSQGDGACFDFNCIDFTNSLFSFDAKMRKRLIKYSGYLSFYTICNNYHYSHSKTRSIECDITITYNNRLNIITYNNRLNTILESIATYVQNFLNGFYQTYCDNIYKELQSEYEDLTSNQTIIEYFNDSDRLFTIDGKFFNIPSRGKVFKLVDFVNVLKNVFFIGVYKNVINN